MIWMGLILHVAAFIHSFIPQYLFIIDLTKCNTFAGSGPKDAMPACKRLTRCPPHPAFLPLLGHSEAPSPSLPCSSVAMWLSTNQQNAGKSDTAHSQPWSLENLPYESLTLSPSVCQPEAEHPTGQSQQKKEETQNGYLEDLTPVTHMEVPFEGKKKKGTPFPVQNHWGVDIISYSS